MSEPPPNSIAIIGMACRFPGAATIEQFWQNLCDGVESITRFNDAELEDCFAPNVRARPEYVKARPILADVEQFDASFFGMYPREAALTDPQQRVFLECAWEALEDAGYDPTRYSGAIGVFAGASMNTYFLHHVCADRATIQEFTSNFQVGCYPMLVGNGDFIATRTAYKLNLRGPAVSVQTACSTSLVAVAQACQSLLMYQSDMALAGGASISFPQRRGYLHQDGGMVSGDGKCRAFDARANGTVFGSGVGVVLLKRLEEALADGDLIHAVIRGSAVNNDGASKVGFTAPSVDGQAEVVSTAQAMAGVAPRSITYVECHGTGTPLGDPIEVASLTKVFRADTTERGFCTLGSVKTNIGHLDAAAGVAGLIKAALSLQYRKLPGTLHFEMPNPRLDIANSPFTISAHLQDWPEGDTPRRAGVSALGVGGTNAHVVLEEAPPAGPPQPLRAAELLVLSARSEPALQRMREQLAGHLRSHPEQPLADVAFTLQVGRRTFPYRFAVACADRDAAIERLASPAPTAQAQAGPPPVVFMFPGQGAQYPDMGRGLYEQVSVFRNAVNACAEVLLPLLGQDLRQLLYPAGPAADASNPLLATVLAQPAIFAVEYALARLWMAWGIKPAAMVGHSVGEFVAACLAGSMALEDALALVAARGELMQSLPSGAMLSVRLPEADLLALLGPDVSIAAINSPTLCVAAGPFDAISRLETTLGARGVVTRRLHTSHAFHSAMMEPVLRPLAARVAALPLQPPQLPWVSSVTGQWITEAEATSPDYWARHCREPVRFSDAVATAVEGNSPVLLEVGPGRVLSTLALQGAAKGLTVAGSLPDADRAQSDLSHMMEALGRLWTAGVAPDWRAVHAPRDGRRVRLPTYPFERERCWIDAPPYTLSNIQPQPTPAAPSDEPPMNQIPQPTLLDVHQTKLQARIVDILEKLSGEDLSGADPGLTFLELGFDSLFLGQFAQELGNKLGLTVAFRNLLGDLPSVAVLAGHAAKMLPPEPEPFPATPAPLPAATITASATAASAAPAGSPIEAVMREQLQVMQSLMARQLDALRGLAGAPAAPTQNVNPPAPVQVKAPTPADTSDRPSRFAVYRPGSAASASSALSPAQQSHIDALIALTTGRTAGSKRYAEQHRPTLADPRAAAGFRAEWKEMVYPIVCMRAHGARIWDVDGNEYIDLVNGYGQTFLGHAPEFVVQAIAGQLQQGFAIGPQSPLAGEVAALLCELTGNERATFCNTGSEAVMAALRISRAVTGRERIVVFGGGYHGQFDEVLVKGVRSGEPRALPVAPGIPVASVQNMVVLPYATPESLDWVRAHAGELAAVVVEPVQSRHPSLQPRDFLTEIRTITDQAGTALVFDEVVTGFRMHPGGMQALFGIKADMVTYGKVLGGGMPIGVLAGKSRFMDALDGGRWDYGDDSYPMVAPTFFAGTFVRHPLTLAAAKAVLLHLKEHGAQVQETINARTAVLVIELNALLARYGLKTRIEGYGSLFYFTLAGDQRLGSLLWYHLRARGIYVQEGFPCFLTTEHGDAEIERIIAAFDDSLHIMIANGVLEPTQPPMITEVIEAPPTEPQSEVWLAAQLGDEASCAFNEGISLHLNGGLDVEALRGGLNDVIARHDALRTVFSATGEQLRVLPELSLSIPLVDQSSSGQIGLQTLMEEEARTAFDLINGPLVRACIVMLAPASHVLMVTAHHIICDGWSMNVIATELANRYAARRGESVSLPAVLPFSRYAAQQAAHLDKTAVAYWKSQFDSPPLPIELPTDRPRPGEKSFRGSTWTDAIDAELTARVRKAGARLGCTLFVTLLGAFYALLGRLADTSDLVVGIPSAGQSAVADETLVGHCVNFLPLRASWQEDTRAEELLQTMRQTVLDAYEHQNCTLGTIVRELGIPREPGRVPLVEVQFNLERLGEGIEWPGLVAHMTPNPKRFVNFDLFLNVIESPEGLRLDIDYSTDLFDEATIARWIGHYRTILSAIAAGPDQEIRRLPLLSADECEALLNRWNDTAISVPPLRTDELIAAQATRTPDATAVSCGTERLTYRELEERADRMAYRLRHSVPDPAARVGVMLRRSIELPVALLAIMRAGFTYVPLDPAHPSLRLRNILQESGARLLLADTERGVDCAPPGTTVLRVDQAAAAAAEQTGTLPKETIDVERAAYVIYTSGSTGTPKGVEVTHRALANLLTAMAAAPGMTATDRLLAVTTVAFDIAALEMFLPLTVGAETVIASEDEATDGFALVHLLSERAITTMQATPSLWRILLEGGFRSARGFRMLSGGEPLDRGLADRLLEGGGELWNMYGPTETTIWSSVEQVVPGPVTVGRPIANTRFYILDTQAEFRPIGVAGELYIAGDGLARCYVGQATLTEAAFPTIAVGNLPAQRMYRTGDLARRLPDGRVEILGRRDSQVKLRGYRIELGEIEGALGRVNGVAAAAVKLRTEIGNGQLVGYYVEQPGKPLAPVELTRALSVELPDYMVPALWMRLDAMPMTPNGKIDRRALPSPASVSQYRSIVPEPPRTPIEMKLAEIWGSVLGIDRVGVNDNLFALGADSIHMFRIAARMMHDGIKLSARHLLRHPTIAELAVAAEIAPTSSPLSLGEFVRARRARLSA